MTFHILNPSADIFSSKAEVLVDPVDAQTGAQGKGLAKAFATRFPDAARSYRSVARLGSIRAGDVWVWDCGRSARYVFFAATKDHWRERSRVEFVVAAA